jgi:mannan endo-1,4-beta-mannosidase
VKLPKIKRRRLGVAGVIGAPVAVACALIVAAAGQPGAEPWWAFGFGAGGAAAPVVCPARAPARPLVGVSPDTPWEDSLIAFNQAARVKPHLIVSYVQFGRPFSSAHACLAVAQHGEMMIQLIPRGQRLRNVAAGHYDRYLTSFAHAIADSRAPVVFSFAHEMNGSWYSWGFTHTDPEDYIAAWRHVWQVFHQAGASNVIWCWNINRYSPDNVGMVSPPALWWPGRRYVDWVGIDAYYFTTGQRYGDVFASTVTAVRKFTRRPILIAETAIPPSGSRADQIADLFAGVGSHHLVGVVWFDIDSKQAWSIDNDRAALRAFHQGATGLTGG